MHGNVQAVGRPVEIPALTGLRFFAAFFILFAHANDWLVKFQNPEIRRYFTVTAVYGMPLFFVLSGFVIHYNYSRLFLSRPLKGAVCEFAAARVARLLPLYFCLLLVAIIADDFIAKVYTRPEIAAEIMLFFITVTQSWFYVLIDGKLLINWLFGLSWSISTEWFFYMAYVPAVFVILRLRPLSVAVAVSVIYSVTVGAFFIFSIYELGAITSFAQRHLRNFVGMTENFQDSFYRWLFYFSPYARMFEFFAGCLAAQAFLLRAERPITRVERWIGSAVLGLALAVLVFIGLCYTQAIVLHPINGWINHLAMNFLCAPMLAAVMSCISRYDSAFARFMSLPALVLLGETSYSIYLVHTWTLRIFTHPAPPPTLLWGIESAARVAIAILFTLMVAYASYQLIEVASRRRLRRIFAGWIGATFPGPRLSEPTTFDDRGNCSDVAVGQAEVK